MVALQFLYAEFVGSIKHSVFNVLMAATQNYRLMAAMSEVNLLEMTTDAY